MNKFNNNINSDDCSFSDEFDDDNSINYSEDSLSEEFSNNSIEIQNQLNTINTNYTKLVNDIKTYNKHNKLMKEITNLSNKINDIQNKLNNNCSNLCTHSSKKIVYDRVGEYNDFIIRNNMRIIYVTIIDGNNIMDNCIFNKPVLVCEGIIVRTYIGKNGEDTFIKIIKIDNVINTIKIKGFYNDTQNAIIIIQW